MPCNKYKYTATSCHRAAIVPAKPTLECNDRGSQTHASRSRHRPPVESASVDAVIQENANVHYTRIRSAGPMGNHRRMGIATTAMPSEEMVKTQLSTLRPNGTSQGFGVRPNGLPVKTTRLTTLNFSTLKFSDPMGCTHSMRAEYAGIQYACTHLGLHALSKARVKLSLIAGA